MSFVPPWMGGMAAMLREGGLVTPSSQSLSSTISTLVDYDRRHQKKYSLRDRAVDKAAEMADALEPVLRGVLGGREK